MEFHFNSEGYSDSLFFNVFKEAAFAIEAGKAWSLDNSKLGIGMTNNPPENPTDIHSRVELLCNRSATAFGARTESVAQKTHAANIVRKRIPIRSSAG